MKKKIVGWLVIGVAMGSTAWAQGGQAGREEDTDVVSSFEQRVKLFDTFLAGRPALLEKSLNEKSPTGLLVSYTRFEDPKIEYDVRKTDSLVSPYTGYITVSFEALSSDQCGDIIRFGGLRKFGTVESARLKKDDDSCYRRSGGRASVKFVFAYQSKHWVFKDVEGVEHGWRELLVAAFGTPAGARLPLEDNDVWKTLIR